MTDKASETPAAGSPTHTPGPWGVWWNEGAGQGAYEILAPDGATIATRAPWRHRAIESEANGKLIAAAPALADALEKMLIQFGRYGDDSVIEARSALAAAGRIP